MDKQIRDMKKTITRVSLFRAAKNTRVLIMGLLTIDFVLRVWYHYPVTGLYLLLLHAVVPFLIETISKSSKKEQQEKELPILQEVYGYDRSKYYGQGGMAVVTVITLLGWYQKTKEVRKMRHYMRQAPLVMEAIYLSVLIIGFFLYFRESEERLNNNKL